MRDVQRIISFVRAAELGSFTAAGHDLKLSTSAVSRHITELERRLGFQLIIRSTRRLSLTDVGRRFLEHTRAPLQVLEQASTRVSQRDESMAGEVRIRATLGVGQRLVSKAARDFVRLYPDITVKVEIVRSGTPPEPDCDAFITVRHPGEQADKRRQVWVLAPVSYLVCAAPSYLAQAGTPKRPDDLRTMNCLIHDAVRGPYDWKFREARRVKTVRVHGNFHTNDSVVLQDAVLDGIGIARLPDYAIVEDLKRHALIALFDNLISWGGVIVAMTERGQRPARVQTFLAFLKENIRSRPIGPKSKTP